MFFIRLLLWVVTLPFVIVAHVLKALLLVLSYFGSIVTTILGGVLVIASGVMFIGCFWQTGEAFWDGMGTAIAGLALGFFIYFLPRIGAFLASALQSFIDWAHHISF